jgi:hypothetical protein
MNSTPGSTVHLRGATSATTRPELGLFRLYLLRVAYLLLAAGLGWYMWPTVIHHTAEIAVRRGEHVSVCAGLAATMALGLRYPLQMLPVLLFEVTWKAIYLIAFALPLWSAHQIDAATAENINEVLTIVIFLPMIPWDYVFKHYVMKRGDRWK